MAEAAVFSVAGKLLTTMASPGFKKAYKRVESIWGAKDDLAHLEETIQTVEAVLLDAEKRQEDSAAVKVWVKRVRYVLYDAEDLFDKVATMDLIKQQSTKGNKLIKKVQMTFSPSLNPIISSKLIADQVKAIREKLDRIHSDMKAFNFVPRSCGEEQGFLGEGRETGAFVNPDKVIGRDDDKKAILEFLFDESNTEQDVSIVAIVGIGGMGKTTLAQLVVQDEAVMSKFCNPWWAFISDEPRYKEILRTILQSMGGGNDQNSSMNQLQHQIKGCVSRRGKYLLVLDDLWDEDYGRCSDLKDLLSSGDVKGSKIIVTTRSLLVAKAITADKVHILKGLSEDEKWDLFKMVAFTPEQVKDPRWMSLGREIADMCADIPLAVRSIAGLLRTKTTLQEWDSFKNHELSKLKLSEDTTIATLKLSYDHLKPSLKHCFAYCSMFPKGRAIFKHKLIYLWIAQGYIANEDEGHACVMELLGISFLQSAYDSHDPYYKMHDLVHDLAQLMAGDGVSRLPQKLDQCTDASRHLLIDSGVGDSWEFPPALLKANRLRSCLFRKRGEFKPLVLDQLLIKFTFLRALDLSSHSIRQVPGCIGELLHLRYLDLSDNDFNCLPESFTKLLNLIALDVSLCRHLEALPNDFRKLISLRQLILGYYSRLKHMPPRFREMTNMQRLDYFIVDDATDGSKGNSLDALAQLNLRGKLLVNFSEKVDGWVEDALVSGLSRLSALIEELTLSDYPGMRILSLPTNLVVLELIGCKKLIHLPPLMRFRCLKRLMLKELEELEYVEGDGCNNVGGQGFTMATGSSSSCLRNLVLASLPKLKGSSRKDQPLTLRLGEALAYLDIIECGTLNKLYFPPANVLEELHIEHCQGLEFCDEEEKSAVDWGSLPKLRRLFLQELPGLESFKGQTLNSLKRLEIASCNQLKNVSLPLDRLQSPDCAASELRTEDLTPLAVRIMDCCSFKEIYLPSADSNVLQKLAIEECPEPMSLDWVPFRNLQLLELENLPELESFSVEAFTFLRIFSISRCERLKKLCLRSKNRSVLEGLWLDRCPELELCW